MQAVRKQREAAHRHVAPLLHKVHKVPILIKSEKVLFLTAGYRGTFLVSVYRATLRHRLEQKFIFFVRANLATNVLITLSVNLKGGRWNGALIA